MYVAITYERTPSGAAQDRYQLFCAPDEVPTVEGIDAALRRHNATLGQRLASTVRVPPEQIRVARQLGEPKVKEDGHVTGEVIGGLRVEDGDTSHFVWLREMTIAEYDLAKWAQANIPAGHDVSIVCDAYNDGELSHPRRISFWEEPEPTPAERTAMLAQNATGQVTIRGQGRMLDHQRLAQFVDFAFGAGLVQRQPEVPGQVVDAEFAEMPERPCVGARQADLVLMHVGGVSVFNGTKRGIHVRLHGAGGYRSDGCVVHAGAVVFLNEAWEKVSWWDGDGKPNYKDGPFSLDVAAFRRVYPQAPGTFIGVDPARNDAADAMTYAMRANVKYEQLQNEAMRLAMRNLPLAKRRLLMEQTVPDGVTDTGMAECWADAEQFENISRMAAGGRLSVSSQDIETLGPDTIRIGGLKIRRKP